MEFKLVSEKELNSMTNTYELLESKGNYGLSCVVFEKDIMMNECWLDDVGFKEIQKMAKTPDVGTLAFLGNLTVKGEMSITDRIMCVFIKGNLVVDGELSTYETEVYIGGNLVCSSTNDRDKYITVAGEISFVHGKK
jgi:hypothetical protein